MNKILVIEDEPDIRELILEILSCEGFEVFGAQDGQVALTMFQEVKPDLILCDVMMPNMNGYDFLNEIRRNLTTVMVPFIFLTAKAERSDIRQGMKLGADDYLTKPFSRDDLLEAIQTRLQKQAMQVRAYATQTQVEADLQIQQVADLRRALENSEFVLHYQPQVSLETGAVVGAEVLVRWESPDRGLIPPGEFIPLAEVTGLILPLGEWVLRTACLQVKRWHQLGLPMFRVAVNLSSAQFNQPDLTTKVTEILQETNLDPQWLEMELTESLLVQDVETTIRRLTELKSLGIQIAIDDFGTGYASLAYLQRFPCNTLKIDRCFVRNLHQNPTNAAIALAVIQIAQSLNLKTIAEGVETSEEKQFLTERNCDEMQGYLFSKPLPAAEFEKLLRAAN